MTTQVTFVARFSDAPTPDNLARGQRRVRSLCPKGYTLKVLVPGEHPDIDHGTFWIRATGPEHPGYSGAV